MGRGESTHGGWFTNEPYIKAPNWFDCDNRTIPTPQTLTDYQKIQSQWESWVSIDKAEGQYDTQELYRHPVYGVTTSFWVKQPLPDLTEAEFEAIRALVNWAKLSAHEVNRAKDQIAQKINVTFIFEDGEVLHEFLWSLRTWEQEEVTIGSDWPDGYDYFWVADINHTDETNIRVILEK